MAKREIRKLSRTTNLLFPKRPFQRLVREIAQVFVFFSVNLFFQRQRL